MNAPASDRTATLLFVDDLEANYTSVSLRLPHEFQRLGCELDPEHVADPDVAYDRVVTERFDIVVVDLLFPPPGRPDAPAHEHESRGPEIIEGARRAFPETVIVALTGKAAIRPRIDQEAWEAGADIVWFRGELAERGAILRLAKEIYTLLCERGVLTVGPTLHSEDEPGIQSVLYDIGEANLRLLLTDLFQIAGNEPVKVELGYVAPGASGAHVVRAVATLSDGSTRRQLVKVSRDQVALRRELENYRNYVSGRYDSRLVVQYHSPAVDARNGWSAIAMEYADDAVTLRRWLSDAGSAAQVGAVLDQLFLNRALASGYREVREPPGGQTPIDRLSLPPFRRVLVRHAVEQLAPILSHPDGASIENLAEMLQVVEGFARDGRIGAVPASDTPGDLVLVDAHGDLHGANVLVVSADGPPRPRIIDIAAFGSHHWAADPARLLVDVVLRCLDSLVESYFWRRLPTWRQTTRVAAELGDAGLADDVGNAAVVAALRWMSSRRSELLPQLDSPGRWWEWHVALTEQLLRGAYQQDLPPAKRALALIAAFDQLRTAEAKLPRRRVTY